MEQKRTLFSLLGLFIIVTVVTLQAQWQRILLPGGRGDAVYSLCVKDSFLFAGTDAGIYRSSDNGEHWLKVNPLIRAREYKPQALSVVADEGNIFLALMETGVYKSSNNGESWSIVFSGGGRNSPLELSVAGNWIIGGHPNSVPNLNYQSIDGGENWTSLLIGSISSAATQDSITLAVTSSGIHRSGDYGTTWNKVSDGTAGYPLGSAIIFSDSDVYRGRSKYISISTDRGLTWPYSSVLSCQSINSLVTGPNYVFAGTDSGIFRSSDKGQNWGKKNNGLNANLIFSLAFMPQRDGKPATLFAGTGSGIFQSTNYGETWSVTGSPTDWVFAPAGQKIFAARSNNSSRGYSKYSKENEYLYQTAVCHSTDRGTSWVKGFMGFLEENSQIISLCAQKENVNTERLFIGGSSIDPGNTGIIFVSSDDGSNWVKVYSDPSSSSVTLLGVNTENIFARIINKSALGSGLYRSTDKGNAWSRIDTNFSFYRSIVYDENKIYAGGGDVYSSVITRPPSTRIVNKIILSTDKGGTWEKLETPLDTGRAIQSPNDTMSILTGVYASGQHLLIGMQARYFYNLPYSTRVANGGGVYHLYNDGGNWLVVDSAFIGRSIFGFVAGNSAVFAATDSGVFRTTDYGTTWSDINFGMNRLNISSLFISDNYLFASTTNGLWKRPLSEITSVDNNLLGGTVPEKFILSQNFPNPFNPTTTINYQLPITGYVTLKVYNVLGEEVATLFEGSKHIGSYEATFDGSGLASGIYFYQLKADNFVEAKKLVLLK